MSSTLAVVDYSIQNYFEVDAAPRLKMSGSALATARASYHSCRLYCLQCDELVGSHHLCAAP